MTSWGKWQNQGEKQACHLILRPLKPQSVLRHKINVYYSPSFLHPSWQLCVDENLKILRGGDRPEWASSCFIGFCSLKNPLHKTLCPLKAEQRWRTSFSASSVHALLRPFSWVLDPGFQDTPPTESLRTWLQFLSAQLRCIVPPAPLWGKSVLIHEQRTKGQWEYLD